jgi:hypothetical protein
MREKVTDRTGDTVVEWLLSWNSLDMSKFVFWFSIPGGPIVLSLLFSEAI